LERWGIAPENIGEYDRWESVTVKEVTLTLLPTRHFSGRKLNNRFTTLWGAWVLEGMSKRILFGADTAYFHGFTAIGERFGGFDLVLLECGAYSENWPHVHMFPEETAQAAAELKAGVLMPIHWGKFSLALHPWKEPIERVSAKAAELGIPLLTPHIGRILTSTDPGQSERWWSELL
jgi:L-ascorbate metabolism protein UlaG (beta-lactamase superfamily)